VGERPGELDAEAFLADSRAELDRLAGIHWYAHGFDEQGQSLPIVLGHDACRSILRDRRLSARSFVLDMVADGVSPHSADQFTPLFGRDGEEHRRHRALLSAAFTPRSVERLRPVARAVAARRADAIAATGGRCRFVADFAGPVPPEVFAVLFGLPTEDRSRLGRWAEDIAPAFAPPMTSDQLAGVERAAGELGAYCDEVIATRLADLEAGRRGPDDADDLTVRLLTAEADGHRLDHDDVVALMSGFIFAGAETTRRQLTALVLTFADHPDGWERLASDPALIPGAVEEVLRLRGIIPGLTRLATDEFEHDGLRVGAGGRLLLSFESANRDPDAFADPDHFDLARPNAADHLTFGWGPHFCVGAGLARMEMQESLGALVERFGPPAVPPDEVAASTGLGAPDELTVVFPVRDGS
jgi:cytochrome P450